MRGNFMLSFLRLFDCFLKKVDFLRKQTALSCRYRRKIQNRKGRKAPLLPEQAKDFLKDAALRRQAMRKRREAVTQ